MLSLAIIMVAGAVLVALSDYPILYKVGAVIVFGILAFVLWPLGDVLRERAEYLDAETW